MMMNAPETPLEIEEYRHQIEDQAVYGNPPVYVDELNILYCGDHNMSSGIFLSALSLKNQVDLPIHLYILTLNMEINHKTYYPVDSLLMDYLQSVLQEKNPDSSVEVFDISSLFEQELPEENIETRFTPCCMLRLYADQVDRIPQRILYLDTDVLCRKDPLSFYALNLEGKELAGVLDNYGKWWFHKNLLSMDYMNSGVLLLNMEQIRKTGLFSRSREMCRSKNMFMPDQSAINKLTEDPVYVDRRYNEQKVLKEDTVFQHFTTQIKLFPMVHLQNVKPWELDKVHDVLQLHEYDELFAEYQTRLQNYQGERINVQ